MSWRGRLETSVALAMLPVALTLAVVSALAFAATVALGLMTIAVKAPGGALTLLWSVGAALVAVRNILLALKMLNALDWRALPEWTLWSSLALLTYAARL